MSCTYQCVNGQWELIFDTCPDHNCPRSFGECFAPDSVVQTFCPAPLGAVEVDEDAKEE